VGIRATTRSPSSVVPATSAPSTSGKLVLGEVRILALVGVGEVHAGRLDLDQHLAVLRLGLRDVRDP